MAQLDTRLATSIAQPQAISPFRTLGQLAQLKQQQGLNQQRQLANEQRRRQLEDDDAVTAILQRHPRIDDAIDEMYTQGFYEPAGKIEKQVLDQRKAAADKITTDNANHKARLQMATNIFRTVSDQKSLETATAAARPIIGDQLMQYVPKEYGDGSQIKQIVGWGTSQQEALTEKNNTIQRAFEATRISLDGARDWETRQKNKLDALPHWRAAIGSALGSATSQDEWDNHRRIAVGYGAPVEVVAEFPQQWSPANAKKAQKLGMTPNEQSTAANAQQNADLRDREVKVREQNLADREAQGGRQLTPNALSDIEGDTQKRYDALEKDAKEELRGGRSLRDWADDPSEAGAPARREIAQRKLTIENGQRRRRGEPTIEEAERLYAQQGNDTKLRQVRNAYKKLTGEETPMERVEKLNAQIKAETDPVKIAALRKQRADLLAEAGR
jgi:hypothetical protein